MKMMKIMDLQKEYIHPDKIWLKICKDINQL